MINTNVVECARKLGVKKIVAMGSGCVYPDLGDEMLVENQIWLGAPHDSVAAYAHSKRLILAHLDAIKAQDGTDYVFAVAGNIFGPHDSFNLEHGNVAPSLIHKFILAHRNKTPVSIWGSGIAVRDFSHSEDIAQALYLSMDYLTGPVNIGSGHRHKVVDIVNILSDIYEGQITINYDSTKPDGQLLRYYNIDKLLNIDFSPSFDLKRGVTETHRWLLDNWDNARF
jgi:GDP-L-fucose synthase